MTQRLLCCVLQCLKYYTDQQADLKRVEQLNQLFFRLMALGADAPGEAPASGTASSVTPALHGSPTLLVDEHPAPMHASHLFLGAPQQL